VHGSGGPRPGGGSRVHGGPREAAAEWIAGAWARAPPVSGSSPVVVGNEEEACGVPTVGEGGRCGAGGMPATVDRNGGGLELGGRAIRVRMERADARTGNMMWRWCSRAAFIGRGTTEGGRSRSYQRRLGGASMAKPFRAGEKMGRGNKELGR
jgi:hypothetical protein